MMILSFLSGKFVKRNCLCSFYSRPHRHQEKRYSFSNNLNINAFCFRNSLPNNKGCSRTTYHIVGYSIPRLSHQLCTTLKFLFYSFNIS